MIADGKLREDLFQRLGAVRIEMPALRDRPSDVPALALYFLAACAAERGKPISGFNRRGSRAAVRIPLARQRARARGRRRARRLDLPRPAITGADLPQSVQSATAGAVIQIPGSTLDAIERYAITRTLEATSGSTSRAAEILGISIRKVQYKLQEYQGSSPRTERPPAAASSGKRN